MSDFNADLLENRLDKTNIDDNSVKISEESSYSSTVFTTSNQSVEFDDTKLVEKDSIASNNENNDVSNYSVDESNADDKAPDINCLYLTVKKDYSLSIFKNKIKKTIKSSWKIAVSIFVLNFLSSFF